MCLCVYAFDHISLNTHRIAFGLKSKRAIKINVSARAHTLETAASTFDGNLMRMHFTLRWHRFGVCVFFSLLQNATNELSRANVRILHINCVCQWQEETTLVTMAGMRRDTKQRWLGIQRHCDSGIYLLWFRRYNVCVCRCRCECCVYAVSMCLIIFNVVQ